ncbi:MAG: Hsp33 family molecular chaperone HslO [Clostridia bacterium]|nr:Hsp33 family molecular chaperone HslO [Clostridia bacterium]
MNYLYKTLIFDRQVSLSVMETTDLVNKAIKIHSLNPSAAKTLGEMLTCGVYMSGCLKSEKGAVSITVKADDGVGAVSVSGDINLHMRGYIDGSMNGKLKGGYMTVIKDDGFSRPFVGASELISDDVSRNMMNYFDASEQIPTAVSVGVEIGEDGKCVAAGGVVMQLLPGTSDENRDLAEEKMQNFLHPEKLIKSVGAKGIMDTFFAEETKGGHVYMTNPDYICNCSRQKISSVLLAIGKNELYNILEEQGSVSVHCHYCNTDYVFDKKDIDELTNG